MRVGIDAEMQLAPSPARPDTVFLVEPFALAVDLEAGAVDQKVQWLRMIDSFWQDGQTAAATAKRRMIRDGNMDPEHIGDRTKQPLGLTERLVEHQAKCEAGLDGDRRINRLTAPFSDRRRMPCRHGLLSEPYRQTSSPYQRGIVFRPVRHPVSGFWDFMAAAFVEFVRHGFHTQKRRTT